VNAQWLKKISLQQKTSNNLDAEAAATIGAKAGKCIFSFSDH